MRINPVFARKVMQATYAVAKLCPMNRCKITFLSRQSDSTPLDFELLIDEIKARCPNVKISTISCRLDPGLKNQIRYSGALLTSLYQLATSKVCVLDSYWPAVSALNHKSDLVVYQMWHAMGKIKKSGKATVGKPDGRSRGISDVMRIHEGYDYVVSGAPGWNQFYVESFGVSEAALLNIGLPRADYLVNRRDEIARRILKKYPELKEGSVVLYAPTFRARGGAGMEAKNLVASLAPAGFKTVVKGHANQTLLAPDDSYWDCPEFSALELLSIADYLITDYSAIAVEGALIDVQTLFYTYDIDEYTVNNGLNIDLEHDYPNLVYREVAGVLEALQGEYPYDEFEAFKIRYGLPDPGHSTEALADAIFEEGGLCTP